MEACEGVRERQRVSVGSSSSPEEVGDPTVVPAIGVLRLRGQHQTPSRQRVLPYTHTDTNRLSAPDSQPAASSAIHTYRHIQTVSTRLPASSEFCHTHTDTYRLSAPDSQPAASSAIHTYRHIQTVSTRLPAGCEFCHTHIQTHTDCQHQTPSRQRVLPYTHTDTYRLSAPDSQPAASSTIHTYRHIDCQNQTATYRRIQTVSRRRSRRIHTSVTYKTYTCLSDVEDLVIGGRPDEARLVLVGGQNRHPDHGGVVELAVSRYSCQRHLCGGRGGGAESHVERLPSSFAELRFHGTCNPDFLNLSAGLLLNRHCTVKINSTIGFS